MSTLPDASPLPLGVDPFPLLSALDAAAAVFDAQGALRCGNPRWTRLLEERAEPFLPISLESGRPVLLASPEGLAEPSRAIAEGLQAILRGERAALDVALPGPATGSPGRGLSATPCAVDGGRGALVCVRELPPPPAEAAGKPIESFFDAILDHLPLMVFIKEAKEFRLVRCNRRYEELYGISRADLLGKRNSELVGKSDAEYLLRRDREVIDTGEILDIAEERLTIPGRGDSLFHTRKVPFYGERGEPLYILGIVEDITAQKLAEEARAKELAWIETQDRLLRVIHELSTPVIPVHEGILVVPLIGHLDAARSAQMQETLLGGIQRHRAETVLLDITGVPVLDAEVAGHLLEATRAAELLGASCVLVGASPEVARTMVTLGLDLGKLLTRRDLGAGILFALARQGKAIARARPSVQVAKDPEPLQGKRP